MEGTTGDNIKEGRKNRVHNEGERMTGVGLHTEGGNTEQRDTEREDEKDKDTGKEKKKDAGDVAWVSSFEDVMEVVGTHGRWNFLVCFLCSTGSFNAFVTMSYQFLGATPDYWCHVAPLRQANWTSEEIISLALPLNQTTGCQMYDYNYTAAAQLGYNASLATPDLLSLTSHDLNSSHDLTSSRELIFCSVREFNLTQYSSTIVTEWDLVCERRVMYATTQAVNQLGFFFGALIAGFSMDTLGRRRMVLGSAMGTLIMGLATALSPTPEVFIALRFGTSFTINLLMLSTFLIVMETGSPTTRTTFGILSMLSWPLGYMLLPGITYFFREWKLLQVVLVLPYSIFLIHFWLLPESPRWLLQKGRVEESLKVLLWAGKVNRSPMPPTPALREALHRVRTMMMVDDEAVEGNRTKTKTRLPGGHLLQKMASLLSTRGSCQRLILLCVCWFCTALVYFGLSLIAINISADPYLYIFLGGLVELLTYLMTWICLMYIGRRPLISALCFLCTLSICLNAVLIMLLPDVQVGVKIFLSLVGQMAMSGTFQLVYIYTAELFPTHQRSLAVGTCSLIARIGSILSPYINDLLGEIEVWIPSALFSVFALVAGTLTLFLPETKDLILPENM